MALREVWVYFLYYAKMAISICIKLILSYQMDEIHSAHLVRR